MPTSAAEIVAGGCGTTQVYKGGEPDWLTTAGDNNNPKGVPYFITSPATAAGFLFAYPLRAGSVSNPNNKILWVVGLPRDGNPLRVQGHPLAASGTRILMHLLYELKRRGKRYGLGSACIGGGQGVAMIVEAF